MATIVSVVTGILHAVIYAGSLLVLAGAALHLVLARVVEIWQQVNNDNIATSALAALILAEYARHTRAYLGLYVAWSFASAYDTLIVNERVFAIWLWLQSLALTPAPPTPSPATPDVRATPAP